MILYEILSKSANAMLKIKVRNLLQIPDSRPTAKQLESLLNDTDRTAVGFDDSIGGLTFIFYVGNFESSLGVGVGECSGG